MDKGYIPEDQQLKGSWAGAMGQSQFMPTSICPTQRTVMVMEKWTSE